MKVIISSLAALLMFGAIVSAADDPLVTNSDALRAAVDGKKGAAEIKRLAVLVLTEAKKAQGPAPADADKAWWEEHAKYAEQVADYADYALVNAASGAPTATQMDLITTLETESPKSKYLTQDAYILVAEGAMSAQQADRAAAFARKSLTAPRGSKPEQVTAEAHYIIGVSAATKQDFTTADKELKIAMAGVKGTPREPITLFYLGEADYNLGRKTMDRTMIDQGIKYLNQCALIPGQYQSQSSAEVRRMKAEVGEK